MPIRRMNVDVPSEVYDQFKEKCAKDHVLVKDEIFKFICASLDGKIGSQANIPGEEKAVVVEDLDEPIKAGLDEKIDAKIEAELVPIREKLDGLEPTDVSAIRQDVDGLKSSLAAPQTCPKLEQFEEINGKIKVIANFLENHLYLFLETHSVRVCADDIIGLAVLRNEDPPSTKGLDRHQLKELFLKRMKPIAKEGW